MKFRIIMSILVALVTMALIIVFSQPEQPAAQADQNDNSQSYQGLGK